MAETAGAARLSADERSAALAALARTAAQYGAQIASRVQVTGFLREGARVTGVRAVDWQRWPAPSTSCWSWAGES